MVRLLTSHQREAAGAAVGSGPTDLSRSCRLPIPVLRASGTPQRSETRPRAERRAPRRAAVVCARSYLNTAPLPRRRGASGAVRRSGQPSEAPRGGREHARQPPFGLLAPAGPGRQGRAAGGVAARLPPPRPAPGLRKPLASGATRRKSPLPAQQTRPSAAPRPHPRRPPRRLLRSLGVSPAEPARRPAYGVRRAAGAEPAAGTAPIAPTERGVTPLKTELSRWAGVLRRGPTPHKASWLVGSDVGWSLSRGPVATPSYSWGSEQGALVPDYYIPGLVILFAKQETVVR